MSYIIDADWAINALTGHRNAATVLNRLAPQGIAVSWITVCEIYEGAYKFSNPSEHLRIYRGFLHAFRRLAVSDSIAERFAEVRALLRRRGEMIPDFDMLLAATALEHDLTVLTYNVRHFARVPDIRLYSAAAPSG